MNSNTRQLIFEHGYICMLGGNVEKDDITFHHIVKKCDGGDHSAYNGAILSRKMHDKLNFIELHDLVIYEEINKYFYKYKLMSIEEQYDARRLMNGYVNDVCTKFGYVEDKKRYTKNKHTNKYQGKQKTKKRRK